MSLIRISEKKLAANRANARKSTGPRTSEGKARTAQNACKHHLYARTHIIPPEWEARILPQALAATRAFAADPGLHYLRARFLYLELWAVELETLADQYFQHTLTLCHNHFDQAVQQWFVLNPLSRAVHKRRMHIHFEVTKTIRDLARYERALARRPLTLQHQPSQTLAAGAGATKNPASADPSHISLIAKPLARAPKSAVLTRTRAPVDIR